MAQNGGGGGGGGTTPYHPPRMSRPKRAPTGDEEAGATLRLGEFEDVPTLSLSEARYVINAVTQARRQDPTKRQAETETLVKVQEYLEMFARYKQQERVQALEQIFEQTRLDKYERSQLSSLCPDTVEEAKTLVPSVEGKISDEDLERLLDEMKDLRRFAT